MDGFLFPFDAVHTCQAQCKWTVYKGKQDYVSFVYWSIKLSGEFVYIASGNNPAVLRGHLAEDHKPFMFVVIMQNSPNDLKSNVTNHICTGKGRYGHAAPPYRHVILKGVLKGDLISTSCAYLPCLQAGWRHPPEHCVFGCLPVWSQSSGLHHPVLWVWGEHLCQCGIRF